MNVIERRKKLQKNSEQSGRIKKKTRVQIPARNEQFNLREMQMSDEYQAPMIRSPSYGNEKKKDVSYR